MAAVLVVDVTSDSTLFAVFAELRHLTRVPWRYNYKPKNRRHLVCLFYFAFHFFFFFNHISLCWLPPPTCQCSSLCQKLCSQKLHYRFSHCLPSLHPHIVFFGRLELLKGWCCKKIFINTFIMLSQSPQFCFWWWKLSQHNQSSTSF